MPKDKYSLLLSGMVG